MVQIARALKIMLLLITHKYEILQNAITVFVLSTFDECAGLGCALSNATP